jgi:hypothetical protein
MTSLCDEFVFWSVHCIDFHRTLITSPSRRPSPQLSSVSWALASACQFQSGRVGLSGVFQKSERAWTIILFMVSPSLLDPTAPSRGCRRRGHYADGVRCFPGQMTAPIRSLNSRSVFVSPSLQQLCLEIEGLPTARTASSDKMCECFMPEERLEWSSAIARLGMVDCNIGQWQDCGSHYPNAIAFRCASMRQFCPGKGAKHRRSTPGRRKSVLWTEPRFSAAEPFRQKKEHKRTCYQPSNSPSERRADHLPASAPFSAAFVAPSVKK